MSDKKLEVLMQSKNLVETSYNITAIQNRVFYHCLFAAQKGKTGELYCIVKLEDIKNMIPNPNQRTLLNIKKIFRILKDTSLLFNKDDDGDLIECDYNLIAGSEYNTNRQEFKIFFMERLYKHILEYTNYAPLNLEIMAKFTSFYSQRLYEALRMWSRTGQRITHIYKIDTIKFILGVGDKYPEYKNLKQRVLAQAIKEINAVGNMEVDVNEIKEGKRVVKLMFFIYDNEPKTYFRNKKQHEPQQLILLDDNNEETEELIKSMEEYVELPEIELMDKEIKNQFLKYCYDNSINFDDDMMHILNEAIEAFTYKKGMRKITKLNDYKYFLGIFKNKLDDDAKRFAMSTIIFK